MKNIQPQPNQMLRNNKPLDPGSCFKPEYAVRNVMHIRPYSKKELCDIYGISRKVLAVLLKPFLKEIGPIRGRYYTVAQVEIIFNKIGLPYEIKEEN
jgi:hypothetical protein